MEHASEVVLVNQMGATENRPAGIRPEDLIDTRVVGALVAIRTPPDMIVRAAYLLSNRKVRAAQDILGIRARSSREFEERFTQNKSPQRSRAPKPDVLRSVVETVTLLASRLRFASGPVGALCSPDRRPLLMLPAAARAKRELRPKKPIERVTRCGSSMFSSNTRARLLALRKRKVRTRVLMGSGNPPRSRPVCKVRAKLPTRRAISTCAKKSISPCEKGAKVPLGENRITSGERFISPAGIGRRRRKPISWIIAIVNPYGLFSRHR